MFHLIRGSAYLFAVLRASFNFLYTGLVTIFTYIVLIFDIYIYIWWWWWWCMSSSPISSCVVYFLSLHTCFLFIVCNLLYFYFTLSCRDEFCLKCFKNTNCQSFSCHELSSCKVFQEFMLGLYFIVFNKWIWVKWFITSLI